MAVRRWLGDTLLKAGLINKAQLDEALSLQSKSGDKLGTVLVDMGLISETDLLRSLSEAAGIPFIAALEAPPTAEAIALLHGDMARAHSAIPVNIDGRHVVVAMADPFDLLAIRALTRAVGRSVKVVGTPRDVVLRAIEQSYAASAGGAMVASGGSSMPALSVSRGEPT